jgi:putative two-component system response regulator
VPHTKPSILIIENNNPTLELYRRELSRDFQVLACSEITEAAALAHTPSLAAVVLEPGIADGQGWNLLADLKRIVGAASLPIILCSTMDERKRGLEAGAVDFLVKPVLPPVLVETIHRVIRTSPRT